MSTFDACFAVVIGTEGGYTADPADPGNWTGGACGAGECRGTKYGISAAAYPTKDIASLTVDQAKAIYLTDYWAKLGCGQFVPPLALIVFDAGVNAGVGRAAQWLQEAVGAAVDGAIGPETVGDVRSMGMLRGWPDVCAMVLARRIAHYITAGERPEFVLGLANRLARLPWQAMSVGVS